MGAHFNYWYGESDAYKYLDEVEEILNNETDIEDLEEVSQRLSELNYYNNTNEILYWQIKYMEYNTTIDIYIYSNAVCWIHCIRVKAVISCVSNPS